MKAGHNKKSVRVEFVMSEQEAELVKGRMAELGITNLSAYLRKMAVDGYIIHLDMSDIPAWIVCGMAWISCCGDLRTFRKQEKTPLLSRNRHGKILIEGQICFSLKHPSGIPDCPEKTDMETERRRAYASDW